MTDWKSRANEIKHLGPTEPRGAKFADEPASDEVVRLRNVLLEALEILALCDSSGARAERIVAPEDAEIGRLCERLGYGAVMDSAARQWRRRDPIGAHAHGPAVGTVTKLEAEIEAALKQAEIQNRVHRGPCVGCGQPYSRGVATDMGVKKPDLFCTIRCESRRVAATD